MLRRIAALVEHEHAPIVYLALVTVLGCTAGVFYTVGMIAHWFPDPACNYREVESLNDFVAHRTHAAFVDEECKRQGWVRDMLPPSQWNEWYTGDQETAIRKADPSQPYD